MSEVCWRRGSKELGERESTQGADRGERETEMKRVLGSDTDSLLQLRVRYRKLYTRKEIRVVF